MKYPKMSQYIAKHKTISKQVLVQDLSMSLNCLIINNIKNKDMIKIIMENDYEGYFESWTRKFVKELQNCPQNKIETVRVTAGPYRNHGLTYEVENDNIIHLDFYSAVRNGFGSIGITPKELAKEIAT